MATLRKKLGSQSGQGMTEYIIIVALIAIAAIAVTVVFGDNIRKMFGASVDSLAGSATSDTTAQHAGDLSKHRNVTNFALHGGG